MQVKCFKFNRHGQSVDEFESIVQAFVKEHSNIVDMKVWENLDNSSIVVVLQTGVERRPPQEFCLLAWLDVDSLEELANNTLESITRVGKTVSCLSIVTLSRSPRALVAMIVEQRGSGSNGIKREAGKKAAGKSDPTADPKSDTGTKRRQRSGDRKTPPNGSEEHG